MCSLVKEKAHTINGINFTKENISDFVCQITQEVLDHDSCEVNKQSPLQEDAVVNVTKEFSFTSSNSRSLLTNDKSMVCELTDIPKYCTGLLETIMQDVYYSFERTTARDQINLLDTSETLGLPPIGIPASSHPERPKTSCGRDLELEDISLCETFLESLFTQEVNQMTLSDTSSQKSFTKSKKMSKQEKKRKKLLKKLPQVEPAFSFADMGFWTTARTETDANEALGCPVCFEVFYNPYNCVPCNHSYCEPCLRRMAKYNEDRRRPHRCPICRIIISHCAFNQDVHEKVLTHLPEEYQRRRKSEANNRYMKHPLPFTPKLPDIKTITNAISERQREQAESYWKMVLTTAIFFCFKGLVILALVWVFSLFSEDGFISNVWDYFLDHVYQYSSLDAHKKAEITNCAFVILLGFILFCSICCSNVRIGYHNRRR